MSPTGLPTPRRERWQPLRGGLLNLYRYDDEEFHYRDGHLLLRGNNGTGKSRVLALQLPFLLDGEVSSHRIEPDRDPAKRIEWNLLLGKYPDRLGYTWIELGRRDDGGADRYLTLGCGLQAIAGRGLVGKWFFLTDRRVGEDLFLQTENRQPLSKVRLTEVLGERGELFTTAAKYRAAVDRRLFHLGTERYNALVNLLIQLRQPQLSRKLDEAKLSAALSEALQPLNAGLLDDVAEAFRSLEDDRLTVERLEAAHRGVEVFLHSYRRYTQIAARRRAEGVRGTHAAYEAVMRRLRAAAGEVEEKERSLAEITARLSRLELRQEEADAAVRTLESSPQMRDKKALDDADRLATERRADADRAGRELDQAAARRRDRDRQREEASAAADRAWESAEAALAEADRQADEVGLGRDHRAAATALELPEIPSAGALEQAAERLERLAAKRRQAARLVESLGRTLAAADSDLTNAKERHTEAAADLDEGLEQQRRAQASVAAAVTALQEAYRAWCGRLRELEPAAPGDIAEAVDEWGRAGAGASPVAAAVRRAAAAAFERLAARRADLEKRRAAAVEVLEALRGEEERLTAGVHRPPPAPHTRAPEARQSRPGAPLWQLCDFAPEVGAGERAGIEAALEAAGLLDAWITPDGRLLDAGDHDAVLVPGSVPHPEPEESLARVLRPAAERPEPRAAAVGDAVIEGVLRQIGRGKGAGWAWVDGGGRWQLGPLHGEWAKPAAQHLGASAREAERRRRLAELGREIAAAEGSVEELEGFLELQQARQRRARLEAEEAPASEGVHRALVDVEAAAAAVRRLRDRLAEAEARVAERRRRVNAAREERDDTASDLGLADRIDRLPELVDAIGVYLERLAGLWPTLAAHLAARRQAAGAAERASEARRDEAYRGERRQRAEERARRAAVERDTLRSSVGAGVDEILARLGAARQAAGAARGERRAADERRHELVTERALAQKDIEREEQNLEREETGRGEAIRALGRYAATRLLSVALPRLEAGDPGEWSTTRAVEIARRIEADLAAVASDDPAWERNQRDIARHFQTLNDQLLPHGYQPFSTLEDDLFVVMVPFMGRDCTMAELRAHLAEELAERQRVLNAREREVIENHLIGEVATHLHERLHAAEEWVREINDELRERPMSTGMMLRFVWRPVDDGPAGLAAARRRLLGAGGTWSPAEREALGGFLQEQIQQQRSQGEGTWREQLAAALDYREWHRFSVERHQDGQWKRLTRRTHGTGSGGEKAIALTVPQFAAAAAHYRTAHRLAPRLILLDEAFVGVDADMRSKCMGLLHAFDLDFVMTSEREWGCYATLPGLAIYHLSTRPGIDAVGLTRWLWNGRERVLSPHPSSP